MARDAQRDSVHVGPNEVLRFLLELGGLAAMALWGWTAFEGPLKFLVAIGLPLVAALAWGIFRVPNDPGPAVVAVPGLVRLGIELVFFGTAVALLFLAGRQTLAVVFGALVIVHYAVGYRRVRWLLAHPEPR